MPDLVRDIKGLTPVQKKGEYWVKRDDLFEIAGVRGGKVRTCYALSEGATGLVTAGSRASPQVNIVAQIAKSLGIPCRVHLPEGELSPEVQLAKDAGAEIRQHRAGYNSVIISRAKADAEKMGWREIPFGMECTEAVFQTMRQVANVPTDAKRLVVPVGSGMSLSGILTGLEANGLDLPVLGVKVGADPTKRIRSYGPKEPGFMDLPGTESNLDRLIDTGKLTLVNAGMDYHKPAPITKWQGISLDPIYEAKCLPFLQPDDLFWIIGIRQACIKEDE